MPGGVLDLVGQRLIHRPNTDPDEPAAAAKGDQGSLHRLVRELNDALDLVLNRPVEVEARRYVPQVLEQLRHPVTVAPAVRLIYGQREHSG